MGISNKEIKGIMGGGKTFEGIHTRRVEGKFSVGRTNGSRRKKRIDTQIRTARSCGI